MQSGTHTSHVSASTLHDWWHTSTANQRKPAQTSTNHHGKQQRPISIPCSESSPSMTGPSTASPTQPHARRPAQMSPLYAQTCWAAAPTITQCTDMLSRSPNDHANAARPHDVSVRIPLIGALFSAQWAHALAHCQSCTRRRSRCPIQPLYSSKAICVTSHLRPHVRAAAQTASLKTCGPLVQTPTKAPPPTWPPGRSARSALKSGRPPRTATGLLPGAADLRIAAQ